VNGVDLSRDGRARSFRLGSGKKGCLLLHGFTGTPAEMYPLGEALAALGYTAICPLLPGHGTRVEDLAGTGWEDWFDCARSAWDDLGRTTDARVVAGLSMGALLALHLAHERGAEVTALALLAPALKLRNQRQAEHALWLARLPFPPRRFAIVAKKDAPLAAGPPPRTTPSYDEIPVTALASMIRLQHRVRRELTRIHVPTLILEGGLDPTIAPDSAALLGKGLAGPRVEHRKFPRSFHILTEGPESTAVLAAVSDFFQAELGSIRGPV
jgi:carboxylesterase